VKETADKAKTTFIKFTLQCVQSSLNIRKSRSEWNQVSFSRGEYITSGYLMYTRTITIIKAIPIIPINNENERDMLFS